MSVCNCTVPWRTRRLVLFTQTLNKSPNARLSGRRQAAVRCVTVDWECFVFCSTSISSECMLPRRALLRLTRIVVNCFDLVSEATGMCRFIKSIRTSCACECLPKALCSVIDCLLQGYSIIRPDRFGERGCARAGSAVE